MFPIPTKQANGLVGCGLRGVAVCLVSHHRSHLFFCVSNQQILSLISTINLQNVSNNKENSNKNKNIKEKMQ